MVRCRSQWLLMSLACIASSCGKEESAHTSGTILPSATVLGELKEVPGANVTLGFHAGRLRAELPVSGFRMSKFPIVQSQYEECIAAGACEPARSQRCGTNAAAPGIPQAELVASCVDVANAERFCAWVGGKLPTIAQWMLAARGPAVSRFSWGNSSPSCEQHLTGARTLSAEEVGDLQRKVAWPGELRNALRRARLCPEGSVSGTRIGQHSAGASPFGLEDVLLTRSELVITGAGSPYNSCRNSDGTCLITRTGGAEISSLEGISRTPPAVTPEDTEQSPLATYAFRCVWE